MFALEAKADFLDHEKYAAWHKSVATVKQLLLDATRISHPSSGQKASQDTSPRRTKNGMEA